MVVALAVDLFGARQQCLNPASNAKLNQRVARVGLLDDAVDTLADAGIVSGSCLLARVPPPPAAAPGA